MLPTPDQHGDGVMPARLALHQPTDLRGPAGSLEALFTEGLAGAPYAVVVSHPHPLFGGTMHNKVVYHAAKAFSAAGLPVLRYNFRGAGRSAGAHDHGRGEADDLRAAMRWLATATDLPLLLCGFSFGAWVSLQVACGSPMSARGVAALGLPIRAGDRAYVYPFLRECTLPKLFVSGTADAFGPVDQVEAVVRSAAPPARLVWVDGADHFFVRNTGAATGLSELQAALTSWLAAYFLPTLQPTLSSPEAEAWL
jgi:uncharacterized protein